MSIDKKIVDDLVANDVSFVTTVPCKQLAGVIDEVEAREEIFHIPKYVLLVRWNCSIAAFQHFSFDG